MVRLKVSFQLPEVSYKMILCPHYFYTIVADSFSQVINGVQKRLIKWFTISTERLKVSHLQYAADTLILIEGSIDGLEKLKM